MAVAERVDAYGTVDGLPFDDKASMVAPNLRQGPAVIPSHEPTSRKSSTAEVMVECIGSSPQSGAVKVVRPESTENRISAWENISQSWEGRVIYNDPDAREFVAVIRDLTCRSNPDEEVVIGHESVLHSDLELISDGAVFFWNIGSSRKILASGKLGPSKHKYEIRFRRLPPMSAERLAEIRKQSKELSERLHGNHSA
ncbi:TPA: hypothetical protein SLP05_004257 [Pseudomonas putida]|uniref:hypothetical protein n=1 Tax=Pseudomonas putida TaxID=303 RepID=UPI000FD75A41|nr:hypothetical protein [Pseudomonas putida]MDD2019037.1 hypothetical protein [Pseudomonas putida]HEJ1056644.1 hypothetical protein [Pseudomonas putida]